MVQSFESVDEILCGHSNERLYFRVILFIMQQHNMVLTVDSVGETVKCDHSNESYQSVLSCGAVCYTVEGGSKF